MANEKRLRLLSVTTSGGSVRLNASLSSQNQGYSDTITLTGVLEYADGTVVSIGTDQYLPIVIDPGTAIAEEIWLTTTPSGSPATATGIRGVGSSTGAPAHSSGALVAIAPTPYDALLTFDTPKGGNLGFDYYFQGDTTSLPSYSFNGTSYTWAWFNQGSFAYNEAFGTGCVYRSSAGTGSDSIGGISVTGSFSNPVTVTGAFTYTIGNDSSSNGFGGLAISDGTRYLTVGIGAGYDRWDYWASTSSHSAGSGGGPNGSGGRNQSIFGATGISYLRIVYTSATNVSMEYSTDGNFWFIAQSAYNPASWTSLSTVGMFADPYSSGGISCHWLTVR